MREQYLLEIAASYRDMAEKVLDPGLRLEFTEKAERYELVASKLRREPASDEPG
jgi:hypothetical protein